MMMMMMTMMIMDLRGFVDWLITYFCCSYRWQWTWQKPQFNVEDVRSTARCNGGRLSTPVQLVEIVHPDGAGLGTNSPEPRQVADRGDDHAAAGEHRRRRRGTEAVGGRVGVRRRAAARPREVAAAGREGARKAGQEGAETGGGDAEVGELPQQAGGAVGVQLGVGTRSRWLGPRRTIPGRPGPSGRWRFRLGFGTSKSLQVNSTSAPELHDVITRFPASYVGRRSPTSANKPEIVIRSWSSAWHSLLCRWYSGNWAWLQQPAYYWITSVVSTVSQ